MKFDLINLNEMIANKNASSLEIPLMTLNFHFNPFYQAT